MAATNMLSSSSAQRSPRHCSAPGPSGSGGRGARRQNRAAAELLEAWIERVPKAVAEEVEAQHGDEDGEPREEREPRVGLDERDVGLEIPPPARRGRLRAQPQERERGFDDDGGRDSERGGHDDRRQAVREN